MTTIARPTTCGHVCAAEPVAPARVAAVLDAVEVLVAHLRALPGGTDRMRPEIKGVLAAYDELDTPAGVAS
jgi:hypothetical protein